MKKKVLALIMALVMAMSLAACGNEAAGGKRSNSESQESGESSGKGSSDKSSSDKSSSDKSSSGKGSSDKGSSDKDSSGKGSSDASSPLADWYGSQDRVDLENTVNNMFQASGLTYFVTIEEPDTIVYNYQYVSPLDVEGKAREEIDAYFESSLGASAGTIRNDIKSFQDGYGIPLTTIRMVYLNADGTLIYSMDITEDDEAGAASGNAGDSGVNYESLQAWVESDEARLLLQASNKMMEYSGMSIGFSTDGDVFVYEYHLSDEAGLSKLPKEQLDAAFATVVESSRDSITTFFTTFDLYGIAVEAVRFIVYAEDGTELYSAEIANE